MSMMNELENLLRDISEQRSTQGTQPAAQPSALQPIEAEIIDAEPVHQWHKDAADQPIHRLDTQDITEHALHLGSEVGMADDKLDAHIHAKFDHDLTDLDDIYDEKKKDGDSAGQSQTSFDVAAMLRNPQSVRQAIILSEILARPLDRW